MKLSKDFLVTIGSGIFIGAVAFDIFPEVKEHLGYAKSLGGIFFGVAAWFLLKWLTDLVSESGFAIVSSFGFLFHSFLEGAVTAVIFGVDARLGLLVAFGMILHLVPEFFAIVAILRGEGVSLKKSVLVDLSGIAVLFLSFVFILFLLPDFARETLSLLVAVSGGAFLYIGAVSFIKRAGRWEGWLGLAFGLLFVLFWNVGI